MTVGSRKKPKVQQRPEEGLSVIPRVSRTAKKVHHARHTWSAIRLILEMRWQSLRLQQVLVRDANNPAVWMDAAVKSFNDEHPLVFELSHLRFRNRQPHCPQ